MSYESREKTAISVLLATLEFLYEELMNMTYSCQGWPSALKMEDSVPKGRPWRTEEELAEWLGSLAKRIQDTWCCDAVEPFIHL